MVQVRERVGISQKGSMKAVSGSGMASMSDASILFQPRMLEPSNPRPSLKISSVSSRMGQLKCCHVPNVSTNLMSIILAPVFFASSITLLGVLIYVMVSFLCFPARRRADVPRNSPGQTGARKFLFLCLLGSFRVIALFSMFGKIQAGGFDFRRHTEADNGLH